jgi:hypothetical protein
VCHHFIFSDNYHGRHDQDEQKRIMNERMKYEIFFVFVHFYHSLLFLLHIELSTIFLCEAMLVDIFLILFLHIKLLLKHFIIILYTTIS